MAGAGGRHAGQCHGVGCWDTQTGEPAAGSRRWKQSGSSRCPRNALGSPTSGILHFYLHTMEMSASPEVAKPTADLLRGLVPDAGHLQHMPSHIDVLCGATTAPW